MQLILIIFQIIVLIFSVIIHEISHGYLALKLGDRTAKDSGRLTINPAKHIDPIGSIFLPFFLAIAGLPIIGWAKPVPYNPNNLKNPKKGAGFIALAGPLSNIILAVIFALIIRVMGGFSNSGLSPSILLLNFIVLINLLLAFFNLIPIPPLDGSKILFSLLPRSAFRFESWMSRYGMIVILLILFTVGFGFLWPLVESIHHFLVGPVSALIF
ncbi:MAG: site-2 protease family protein [Candidatus Harrisonbacteria bacterium CG10_big_fil_rev_8_21_14_0_10_44_23]|uniref:Site-2 protease family protein n=1 Tax=Candidatus Harrisonbacteria bacterium CG10_big_fil_rev_8_21_14_0_10_44_23 TaxID=1974585 RepID=A0A2H0UQ34_9BACT|nr:MAG: site-2 protease family protein [Candidatus Harrisonbacteria bacterium CG10_big_fil_rev_8_21_14_0_10_44_23]